MARGLEPAEETPDGHSRTRPTASGHPGRRGRTTCATTWRRTAIAISADAEEATWTASTARRSILKLHGSRLWRQTAVHPFPGVWIAWGFEDGFKEGDLTPTQFAQKARRSATSGPRSSSTITTTTSAGVRFVSPVRRQGLKAGVWFTDGGNISLTPPDADFAIAELEGPGDYDGIMLPDRDGKLPPARRRS